MVWWSSPDKINQVTSWIKKEKRFILHHKRRKVWQYYRCRWRYCKVLPKIRSWGLYQLKQIQSTVRQNPVDTLVILFVLYSAMRTKYFQGNIIKVQDTGFNCLNVSSLDVPFSLLTRWEISNKTNKHFRASWLISLNQLRQFTKV